MWQYLEACRFSKPFEGSDTVKPSSSAEDAAKETSFRFSDKDVTDESLPYDKSPSVTYARVYEALVRKFHIDNAVEADVLLRCHLDPAAPALLQSVPAPSDDPALLSIIGTDGFDVVSQLPPLPPLSALFEPENMPLARCLLFAELNCVTPIDPFVKFPRAASFMTRPTAEEISSTEPEVLEQIQKARNDRNLIETTPIQQMQIQARLRDVKKMRMMHARNDAAWYASGFNSGQSAYGDPGLPPPLYNPRAIRAEYRDAASLRLLTGVRNYQRARRVAMKGRHAVSNRELELQLSRQPLQTKVGSGALLRISNSSNPDLNPPPPAVPANTPTLCHFDRLVCADPHVEFVAITLSSFDDRPVSSMLPSEPKRISRFAPDAPGREIDRVQSEVNSGNPDVLRTLTGKQLAQRIRHYASELSGSYFTLALEYHIEKNRRVHQQVVKFTAALLDAAVELGLTLCRSLLQQPLLQRQPTDDAAVAAVTQATGCLVGTSSLPLYSNYVPFEKRALDQMGFPIAARLTDYVRWMAPPAPPASTIFRERAPPPKKAMDLEL